MASVTGAHPTALQTVDESTTGGGFLSAFATLVGRRFALTVRTPRELFVPLLTPILFALVIAPALKKARQTGTASASFVAIGTVGRLIPLNTMCSGFSVSIDRARGARRELLAAPIPRPRLVRGNLVVAVALTAFQVVALIVAALARGIDFHTSASGGVWSVTTTTFFAVGMYGLAEVLANRGPQQKADVSRVPALAILP